MSNRNENGQTQQIPGIKSYTQVLPSFNSRNPTANIAADTPGNLVLGPAIPSVYYLSLNTLIHPIAHIL